MSARAHYFKIGLFVIVATTLLVIGLIVLGAGVMFRERILLETYINESIQGVEVGTPVKFRGVPIGNIKEVDFVYNLYPEAMNSGQEFRYVYLLMEVNPKSLGNLGGGSIPVFLAREVRRGLRVGLTPQGLTGQFFLELDYYDPQRYPEPPIAWAPTYHYIPSVQSTITYFIESIAKVFAKLEHTDFAGILDETSGTLKALHRSLNEADIAGFSREARATMEAIQRSSDRVSRLLDEGGLNDLTSQTRALVVTARSQIAANGDQLLALSRKLGQTASNAQRITERMDGYLGSPEGRRDLAELRQTLGALRQATETLPGSLERTLSRADQMLESQQHDMELILENFRQISENLRALSERARDYPSGVLFGGPPPARTTPQ